MNTRLQSQARSTPTLTFTPVSASFLQRKCDCGETPGPTGECAECRRKRFGGLQRRTLTQEAQPSEAPPIVHDVLNSPGQPLDPDTRAYMEPRFGHDFGQVRVHADARAAESARAVNALAYTVGRDVVFGAGQHRPRASEGRRLLAHELTHVVQQTAAGEPAAVARAHLAIRPADDGYEREAAARAAALVPTRAAVMSLGHPAVQRQPAPVLAPDDICELPGQSLPARPGDCTAREPENCATYGQWIGQFRRLRTFSAADTAPGGEGETDFSVLGDVPASHEADAPEGEQAVPPVNPQVADRFVDHPTDTWVRRCLPDNLRETAYRLPSDCADIAVILRHVWLAAHHRTETYGGWTVGDRAGGAARRRAGSVIARVFSGNVARMVNAYSDRRGRPLRSFAALQDLLHPGDILVWEHHEGGLGTRRTGGHTQTIMEVTRDGSGRVTRLTVLQGNQPIFARQAEEIRRYVGRGAPPASALRDAPGRRIETNILAGEDLRDQTLPPRRGSASPGESVWTWADGHTTLVAAGPPAAAARPPMRREGSQRVRRTSDWVPALRGATRDRMAGVIEAALQEVRALIEGGQAVSVEEAEALGQAAGERLWRLAQQARDLGDESHFEPLRRTRAVIRALGRAGGTPRAAEVVPIFDAIEDTFNTAARGGTSIEFGRRVRRGVTLVKTLLTGFDPFNTEDSSRPPRPGEWNPSGSAVLALDGTTVSAGSSVMAAVEGVVLPVSFSEFESGLVERIVRPHAQDVDAVITVSQAPSIAPGEPVRLERYAVGVRELSNGALRPIPEAGQGGAGPAIIETQAPLEEIAAETERPAGRGAPAVPRPTMGEDITFRFANSAQADRALTALQLPPTGDREVTISDRTALRQIIATMQRDPNGADIRFQAGRQTFVATVLSGPGGNFLSNEVSFRVLRLLGEARSPRDPLSFHVHTQRGTADPGAVIPRDTSTPAARAARRTALALAARVRATLIATLQRIIRSVATRIGTRLRRAGPGGPNAE